MKEHKEECEELNDQVSQLDADLRKVKSERDSIAASLQLALTKADSEQLLKKISEDQVGAASSISL